MTSRKALLIHAPGGECHNMSDVNADLEATREFLMSPQGGAWKSEEITVLVKPSLRLVLSMVDHMKADYTITFFSGKSFPDKNGNHFLVLNDGDFFQDTELLNHSGKQLVLVDACREPIESLKLNFTGHPSDYHKARLMYDKWIESCEAGQVILHATEQSTLAPKKNNAGIFTQRLLQIASTLPSVENRFNLKSILAAGHETPDLLLEDGVDYGPAITYASGNVKLPFAMAMPKPPALLPPGGMSSGLALGLFLIAFLLGE